MVSPGFNKTSNFREISFSRNEVANARTASLARDLRKTSVALLRPVFTRWSMGAFIGWWVILASQGAAQEFSSSAPLTNNFLPAPQARSNEPVRSAPSTNDPILERVEFVGARLEDACQLLSAESGLTIVASEAAKNLSVTVKIRNRMPASLALEEFVRQTGTWLKRDPASGVITIYAKSDRDSSAWDPAALREFERAVNEAFPNSAVKLASVGKQLLVRGQAHDVIEASRIIRLIDAEVKGKTLKPDSTPAPPMTQINSPFGLLPGLAPREPELTVIDMLTVIGEQQVALKVTVAEVDRDASRQIGLNFGVKDGNVNLQSLLGTKNTAVVGGSNPMGGTFPTTLDNGQIQLAINALRSMSLAKTLAEPTLTSLNGQPASFQAGGQFPVPIVSAQAAGSLQGVSFVPFGIRLEFTPYITDRDRIRLNMAAEVSSRQTQNSIAGDVAQIGTTEVRA